MSPYKIDGELVTRVTEIIGDMECQATGYARRKHGTKPISTHAVSLPGTITHARVEAYEYKKLGITPPKFYFDPINRKLMGKIKREHNKAKSVDEHAKTTYEDMMNKVSDCYANFLAFDNDYPHVPLEIEKRIISKQGFGGTTDMVALFKIKGYLGAEMHVHENLPRRRYWIPCHHTKKTCACGVKEVAVMADWKTSSRPQKGHAIQMSAYFYAWEETGEFDKIRAKGHMICYKTLSLLLGKHGLKNTTTPYRIFWYDPEPAVFLAQSGREDAPGNISLGNSGKTGLKGRCMFCSNLINCPDRMTWDVAGDKQAHPVFLTGKELRHVMLLINNWDRTGSTDLRKKMIATFKEVKEDEDTTYGITGEIMNDIETRFGLLTTEKEIQD